jgi:hypothetical protein
MPNATLDHPGIRFVVGVDVDIVQGDLHRFSGL